ncbi:MAG: toll/interleukin-1 receptor domain-containing protein [Candidatus Latescibacterota bacterium]
MAEIFVSYRREDSAGYSGRLYDQLSAHFGKENTFMDIDAITPGEDFVTVLEQKVASCNALIAVIGKSWLTCTDGQGRRRLDDPQDFVRLEIAAALNRQIPVIPTLVGGANMPRQQDLPEALTMLARRQAIEISDTRFHQDAILLIEALERIVGAPDEQIQTSATAQVASPKAVDISGKWKADNPGLSFDNKNYPMYFTFRVFGNKLLGTMSYNITGETKIVDGTIDGDTISFRTKHAYVLGFDSVEHPYTFDFMGKASGDEISFVRQGERPGLTFKNALDEFTAKRDTP